MVIKCYQIDKPDDSKNVFATALKQFCLLKVASGLGVGPKLMKHGEYDIIFSQRCLEFAMEQCQEVYSIITKENKECDYQAELTKKLKILHTFQFIHLDIKPSNIMYSSIRSETVYIDYGFSKLIKEKIGFKTNTCFAGSMNYCGP